MHKNDVIGYFSPNVYQQKQTGKTSLFQCMPPRKKKTYCFRGYSGTPQSGEGVWIPLPPSLGRVGRTPSPSPVQNQCHLAPWAAHKRCPHANHPASHPSQGPSALPLSYTSLLKSQGSCITLYGPVRGGWHPPWHTPPLKTPPMGFPTGCLIFFVKWRAAWFLVFENAC